MHLLSMSMFYGTISEVLATKRTFLFLIESITCRSHTQPLLLIVLPPPMNYSPTSTVAEHRM
jgi:hypothetical protein